MHRQTGICVQTCPVPTWVPTSNANLRLAQDIYGYWGPVVATYPLCFGTDASLGLGPLLPLPQAPTLFCSQVWTGQDCPTQFSAIPVPGKNEGGKAGTTWQVCCGREVHTDLGAVYRCGGRSRERQHLWVGSCLSTLELKSRDLAF